MKKLKPNKLNFIDVFAGAGGLSCGLEMAGMQCVLGIDSDKYAMQTFQENHLKAQSYCGDVSLLTKSRLKEMIGEVPIHAVVGGPPCQGFSTVGLGNPEDMRNKLFMEFLRLVRVTNPIFVVIENVTGLLAQKNESTLKSIFKKFAELGYQMDVQVMSSQNYGVPEKRRRTILIGTKLDVKIEFPKFSHDTVMAKTYRPAVTVGDAFEDLQDQEGQVHNHDLKWAEVKSKIDLKRLRRVPEGKGIRYKKDEMAYLTPSLRLGVDWETMRENRFRQAKYQRLERTSPSPTIMTHRHSYFHPVEHRYLTQREAARIQSFPNNFIFCGPISAQWRQIGNAVPPLMAKAIGKSLLKMHKQDMKLTAAQRKELRSQVSDKILNYRKQAFVYREAKTETRAS